MRVTAVAIALIIVLGCFVWVMVGVAMPSNSALTMMRMKQRVQEIEDFAAARNALPNALEDLGTRGGESFVENASDYWKRPLRYSIDRSGGVARVRLESLGQDGVPGGKGENRDLVIEFDVTVTGAMGPTTGPSQSHGAGATLQSATEPATAPTSQP